MRSYRIDAGVFYWIKKMSNKLPTIADIYNGVTVTDEMRKNEQFLALLNRNPPQEWVKVHPFIKDFKYLPIDKVEFLLRTFFGFNWQIIIHECNPVFNGFVCRVSLKFKHPITGEWMQQDGVGAKQLQLRSQTREEKDKGIKVAFCHENLSNGAIEMAVGIAETVAIKDACDKLGALFGANLNRKDALSYQGNPELMPEIKLPDYSIERAAEVVPKWIEKGQQPDAVLNNLRQKFEVSELVASYITFCLTVNKADKTALQAAFSALPAELQDNQYFIDLVMG